MSKFLSVSLAMLCGVSFLGISNAAIAVKFGEDKELDGHWKNSTRTLGTDVEKLVKQEGSVEEKIKSSATILEQIKIINGLSDIGYELAHNYRNGEDLKFYIKRIAGWIYPTAEEKTQREAFIVELSQNSQPILPNKADTKSEILGGLKINQAPLKSEKEKNPFIEYCDDFKKARDSGRMHDANDALEMIIGLSESGNEEASKWLSKEQEANLFMLAYEDFLGKQKNTIPATLKKEPTLDLQKEWDNNYALFLANYKTDYGMAQFALNNLWDLAPGMPDDVRSAFEGSFEVAQFAARQTYNMEKPLAVNLNKDEFKDSVLVKVQYHENVQELRKQFKPILDELVKLKKNVEDIEKGNDPKAKAQSVHLLDKFVDANLKSLINIANKIFPENGKLKLNDLKTKLKKLVLENPALLQEYRYDIDKKTYTFTAEQMNKYIDTVFDNNMPIELCSHVLELSVLILNSKAGNIGDNKYGITRLFDAIVENDVTKGGCLPGRKNRQFVALVSMLTFCGLN